MNNDIKAIGILFLWLIFETTFIYLHFNYIA